MAADDDELIQIPDMVPEEKGSLYCFLDHARPCGPECMAHLTFRATLTKTDLSEQQQHCTLLVNADRLARHIVVLTSLVADSQKKQRTKEQDRQREQNTPKPGSLVGSIPNSPFPVNKS